MPDPGHSVFTCRQTSRCHVCKKKHHSLLHPSVPKSAENSVNGSSVDKSVVVATATSSINDDNNVVESCANNHNQVLLATALVDVESGSGICKTFRALLDQGSQASFVTESAVQALGLQKVPGKTSISGVGDQNDSIVSKSIVSFSLKSIHDPNYQIVVKAHVLKKLTSVIPSKRVRVETIPNIIHLQLADPNFHIPNKVDLLLGADVYSQILVEGLLKGPAGTPVAQNTKLGWILSGMAPSEAVDSSPICLHNTVICMNTCVSNDDDMLKKFWELESESKLEPKLLSEEEQACENLYAATTTRDADGRYVVKLPFRSPDPECKYGNSLGIAAQRLKYLRRRLEKNVELKNQYAKVMEEYLTLGHMELVPEDQRIKSDSVYLPHHAVVREDKTTTKVRVVFNASSPGSNGISLNNDLMVGPRLQLDLRHIVMRWRRHPIAVIADIVKMYRQIKVTDEDIDYQRILWADDSGTDTHHYRMLRVTFGTASAPYLAVKTLIQLAKDENQTYPLASEKVLKDFYMDDLMTGCQTIDESLELYRQMNGLMKKGCFELQKWDSNSSDFRQRIDESAKGTGEAIEIGTEKEGTELKKVLGLKWNKLTDEFEYTVQLSELNLPVTKRKILSDISRLFDPLGWIAPSTIQAKIFIQKLWMAGLEWDQELPEHLLREWIAYRNKLSMLTSFTIPRWTHTKSDDVLLELHGFCDASQHAYAAVVYLRVVSYNGEVHVCLITSKTKVAPIKVISIPRLELCGAVLLTKLLSEVSEVLEISKDRVHAWTDSQVVLTWLSSHPSRWKTFIANRVSNIMSLMDRNQWSHVRSSENPADCASRGDQPSKEAEIQLWKNGPSWLSQKVINYSPLSYNQEQDTNIEEKADKTITCLTNVEVDGASTTGYGDAWRPPYETRDDGAAHQSPKRRDNPRGTNIPLEGGRARQERAVA
ncbi:uncharacterized protein LOC135080954 [Ostrinia nubilalis]|uniref:uncharacterized protein LOC135080954 n=1 Tax=Ostrinia nubilalis TaxID=29057 RepID=UPI0030822BFB